MSTGEEVTKPTIEGREHLALEKANEKVKGARWDLSVAVTTYAILSAVVLLRLEGLGIELVAAIAVLGLVIVWLIGWRRGRRLLKRYYNEELSQLPRFSTGQGTATVIPSPLTIREEEILNYVARGYTNKEIANVLSIAEETVGSYISDILVKLNAYDRTQAVVLAMYYGWISPPLGEPSESAPGDES